MLVYCVTARGAASVEAVSAFVARTPGMVRGLVFTPGATRDPYLDDGAPPDLALELYFADIVALEAAQAALAGLVPLLAGAQVTQQAMLVRRFAVPDPVFRTAQGAPHCSYLVAYEGTAEDLNLWLSYYIAHHPGIMARFPGIRQIEIFTRIDWCGALPWARVEYMQRNKVVFDDAAALTAALNSPVRHEMRADFKHFPPFNGRNTHFAMLTHDIAPAL